MNAPPSAALSRGWDYGLCFSAVLRVIRGRNRQPFENPSRILGRPAAVDSRPTAGLSAREDAGLPAQLFLQAAANEFAELEDRGIPDRIIHLRPLLPAG